MNLGFSSIVSHGSSISYSIASTKSKRRCGSFAIASCNGSNFASTKKVGAFIQYDSLLLTSRDKRQTHRLKVGNKSINQLILWHKGFHIPNTVALDFSFFKAFKRSGDVELQEVYKEKIANRLGASLAIRCSSNLEDGHDRSFAGVFDTYLDVPNEYSAFKEKVLQSYQRFSSREGMPEDLLRYDINLGIMVQGMVSPKFSGFLFTMDPVNPPNQWIKVEYWHGEREKSKDFSLTLNGGNGKRIRSNRDSSVRPLPIEVQKKIFKAAKRLDQVYDFPQDAEFLVCEEGERLYLVQSRPITAFNFSPDKVRLKEQENLSRIHRDNKAFYEKDPILSSTNISELFLRAIPLGYSIFKHGFAGTHKKEGGISIGRSRLGYARLDLEDQIKFFYTVADQARTNILVDALTFRLSSIPKAIYLDCFVSHYVEQIKKEPNTAIYPEDGLYLQTDESDWWSEIAGEKGARFRNDYAVFLQNLIYKHAPKVYEKAAVFFKKNDQFYRYYLNLKVSRQRPASDVQLKKEVEEILEYLRATFCPQYVVFGRLAFLCTHIARKKLDGLLNGDSSFSPEYVLNELLRSVTVSADLDAPDYAYYEYLLKTGEISLVEFLDKFQHLGSLDIHQPRLGEYSIEELFAIFGQNKNYDVSDGRLRSIDNAAELDPDIAALGLDRDVEFKMWYTFGGRFMRLREQAKFELLKVLFVLKLRFKQLAKYYDLGDLIYYLEEQEVLDLTESNRDKLRLKALQIKAHFDACNEHRVKDVLLDFFSTPFEEKKSYPIQSEKNGYKFVLGKTIHYGQAEGICLTARSNEEYLRKLAAYRADNIENIIGIFKGVELSYFNLGALVGFTTENGGFLAHAATIAREFRLPYVTNINQDHFQDGDYVIMDTENEQVIFKSM